MTPGDSRGDHLPVLSPEGAAWAVRALIRDAGRHVRSNGATLPPFAHEFLQQLAAIAGEQLSAMPDDGHAIATLSPVGSEWVTPPAAADRTRVGAEHVRRLARQGRIRCRRVGRTWLIDLDSLESVLRKAQG